MKGRKTGGRQKGSPNKTTVAVREALVDAFDHLGGIPSLVAWAREDPAEFYKLWAKLLPTEVKATIGFTLDKLIEASYTKAPDQ